MRVYQKRSHNNEYFLYNGPTVECVVLLNETNQYSTSWLALSTGRYVKVEIVTSPYEEYSYDCNMHSEMFYVSKEASGIFVPDTCGKEASDRVHSINIESRLVNSAETLSENSMEITLTWEAPVDEIRPSMYFISLMDALISPQLDCRNPGDHPPCFFTTDTSVVIGSLDPSRKYIVNIDAYNDCDGYGLIGVYSHCSGDCCQNHSIPALSSSSSPLQQSSSPTSQVETFASASLPSHQHSTTVTVATASAISSANSVTIQATSATSVSHGYMPTRSTLVTSVSQGYTAIRSSDSHHTPGGASLGTVVALHSSSVPQPPNGNPHKIPSSSMLTAITAAAASLGVVLLVIVMVTLLLVLFVHALRKKHVREKTTKVANDNMAGCAVERGDTVSFSSTELLSNGRQHSPVLSLGLSKTRVSASNEEDVPPAASLKSSPPLRRSSSKRSATASKDGTVVSPLSPPSSHSSVLVIYSPRCPTEEKEVILQLLMSDLPHEYGVHTTSHDWNLKGNTPMWIEREVKRSAAVLCVCNEQFWEEWEREVTVDCTVVYALQQIMYALLSQCEDLSSKFAVVLMKKSDHKFIPTQYLQSVKQFCVTELDKIAHFVTQVPLYEHDYDIAERIIAQPRDSTED